MDALEPESKSPTSQETDSKEYESGSNAEYVSPFHLDFLVRAARD